MHAGRLLGHEERVADLAVRAPLGNEDENLALARGEAEGILLAGRLDDGLGGSAVAAGEDEARAGGKALDLVAQPAGAERGGDLVRALERGGRRLALAGGPVEDAWLRSAEAEHARANGKADPALHETAAQTWEAVQRPYPAALMRWRAGEAHVAAGEREAATAALERAHEIATTLGAGWLRDEIEGLAARARLVLSSSDGAPAGPVVEAASQEDPFGLTPRERQVLVLVAEGRTNREIGDALFMAEKTASVHVSRILAKLDVRSRTEAAAVAHRVGLDGDAAAARPA